MSEVNKPWFAKGWFHLCIWSLAMLLMTLVAFWKGKKIPDGATFLFATVITVYGASKSITTLKANGKEIKVSGEK